MILLDEPFSALDAYLKEQLLLELLELLKDYSGDVILVTHSRDEAYKICPELMIVREGRQMEKGSTRALFQNPEYLETARMTGCKNLLKARKCGPNEMELTELGIRLVSEQPVLGDVALCLRSGPLFLCAQVTGERGEPPSSPGFSGDGGPL